jgi:thioredoxin-like negative regulator of GroEL
MTASRATSVGASRPAVPVRAERRSEMANRFNVKIPVTENPNEKEIATLHVKDIADKDFEAEVLAANLPIVLGFYSADSKPCETLAPRFAAVAQRYAGKVGFVRILRQAGGGASARLGVTGSPTVVFFKGGKEAGERLSGDEIQRTVLKSRVEALLA